MLQLVSVPVLRPQLICRCQMSLITAATAVKSDWLKPHLSYVWSVCVNIPEFIKRPNYCMFILYLYIFSILLSKAFSSHLHTYITVGILFDNFSLKMLIMFLVLIEWYLFLSLWLQYQLLMSTPLSPAINRCSMYIATSWSNKIKDLFQTSILT